MAPAAAGARERLFMGTFLVSVGGARACKTRTTAPRRRNSVVGTAPCSRIRGTQTQNLIGSSAARYDSAAHGRRAFPGDCSFSMKSHQIRRLSLAVLLGAACAPALHAQQASSWSSYSADSHAS